MRISPCRTTKSRMSVIRCRQCERPTRIIGCKLTFRPPRARGRRARDAGTLGPTMSTLARFVALYAFMYAAFGVSSPFLPAFFADRGLRPEDIGLLLGTGTAIRLV